MSLTIEVINPYEKDGTDATPCSGGQAMSDEELAKLDLQVARAIGWTQWGPCDGLHWQDMDGNHTRDGTPFTPSTEWSDAGPLVTEYNIDLERCWRGESRGFWWKAGYAGDVDSGPTPLIAICRAVIAAEAKP